MPLPLTGSIDLSAIATEFRQQVNLVRLQYFLKGKGIVKDIPINKRVPYRNPIKISDFYGAAYFYLNVSISITPETYNQYALNNNGLIFVTIVGSGGTYQVKGNGQTLTGDTTQGKSITFTIKDCNSDNIIDFTVADLTCGVTYPFSATVGYNGGLGTVSGITGDMNLGQLYPIG